MTVSSTTRSVSFSCNGSTYSFDFPFKVFEEGDIRVFIRDSDEVETELTYTTNYEVSNDAGNFNAGGTVTTVSYSTGARATYAYPSGNTLIIMRDLDRTQETDYVQNTKINMDTLENDLDRAMMIMQEIDEKADRALVAPVEDGSPDMTLPLAADRASRYLAFDSSGNPIASGGGAGSVPVSSFVETLLDETSAADFLTSLGLDTDLLTLSLPASTTISAFMKTVLDDADQAAAQTTLGIHSVPTGGLLSWPTETVPTGYLERDGSSLSRTTYAALFAVIGTMYGAADATHFNLPDDRGRFERGWDHGAAVDPDRATRTAPGATGATLTAGDHVGTEQAEGFKAHVHTENKPVAPGSTDTTGGLGSTAVGNTGSTGGNETRPINRAYMPIIKY